MTHLQPTIFNKRKEDINSRSPNEIPVLFWPVGSVVHRWARGRRSEITYTDVRVLATDAVVPE